MAFDAQINFRATAGYTTDGPGQTYCLGEGYPVSRGGITFGYVDSDYVTALPLGSGLLSNISSDNGPELAGSNMNPSGNTSRFRLDLPAPGTYLVTLAITGTSTRAYHVELTDLGTSLWVAFDSSARSMAGVAANAFGTVKTYAEWLADRAPRPATFSTSTLILNQGPQSGNGSGIAHLRVQSVDSAPTISPVAAAYLHLRRMRGK